MFALGGKRTSVKCVRVSQQEEVRWRHAPLTTRRNEPNASASSVPGPKKRQSETRKGPRSGERPKATKRLRPTLPKGNQINSSACYGGRLSWNGSSEAARFVRDIESRSRATGLSAALRNPSFSSLACSLPPFGVAASFSFLLRIPCARCHSHTPVIAVEAEVNGLK